MSARETLTAEPSWVSYAVEAKEEKHRLARIVHERRPWWWNSMTDTERAYCKRDPVHGLDTAFEAGVVDGIAVGLALAARRALEQGGEGRGGAEPAEPSGDASPVGVAGTGLEQRLGAPLSAVRAPTPPTAPEGDNVVRQSADVSGEGSLTPILSSGLPGHSPPTALDGLEAAGEALHRAAYRAGLVDGYLVGAERDDWPEDDGATILAGALDTTSENDSWDTEREPFLTAARQARASSDGGAG